MTCNSYIYRIYLHLKIINHRFRPGRHRKAGGLSAPGSKTLFSQTRSVNLLFQTLRDFLFGHPFGKGQFLDEQPARQLENFFFSVGQLFLFLDQVQLAQHLGDVVRIAGPDLVVILALPPAPRGDRQGFGLLFLEDIVYCLDLVFTDKVTQAHLAGIANRNHDCHIVVNDTQDIEIVGLTTELAGLNILDNTNTLCRVNGTITNFKHSLFSHGNY